MAQRGRRPGFVMSDEHRAKIQNSNILNALLEHIEGSREMGSTQVTAALGLLKKVMPDISAVELTGDADNPLVIEKIERVIIGPNAANPDSAGVPPAPEAKPV